MEVREGFLSADAQTQTAHVVDGQDDLSVDGEMRDINII